MKLDTKRTVLVGFAFLSICAFWQMYDNLVPLILTNTFHLNETISGAIMAADNVLALFLLPLFGGLSDKCTSRLGPPPPLYPVRHIGSYLPDASAAPVCRQLPRSPRRRQDCPVYLRAGPAAGCHGYLPQPCRGPDAGYHPQAPALQGKRHHQSDGRGGRYSVSADHHLPIPCEERDLRQLLPAVRHCGRHYGGGPGRCHVLCQRAGAGKKAAGI